MDSNLIFIFIISVQWNMRTTRKMFNYLCRTRFIWATVREKFELVSKILLQLLFNRIEKSEHLCSHHLEVCCSEKDIIDERPNEAQKRTFQDCGRRNVNGVGFRVVDAVPWGTQFGEFPWMVGLLEVKGQQHGKLDKWYFCGGSLIEPNVVVTAAHCVSKKQIADLIVRAGEWDANTVKEMLPYQVL